MHLSRTIVIIRCPSSVVRPSVVVNFSYFRLLLWNRQTEFNKTWQEARSQRPLQSLCLSDRSEKQDGRPGLWLAETFSTSPLKPLNGIQRNLTGSKISMSSTNPASTQRWNNVESTLNWIYDVRVRCFNVETTLHFWRCIYNVVSTLFQRHTHTYSNMSIYQKW